MQPRKHSRGGKSPITRVTTHFQKDVFYPAEDSGAVALPPGSAARPAGEGRGEAPPHNPAQAQKPGLPHPPPYPALPLRGAGRPQVR